MPFILERTIMNLLLVLSVILSGIISVQCFGEMMMIGPGRWLVEDITTCEDSGQYAMIFEVSRQKINRTHDGFSLYVSYDHEMNDLLGVEIDMYQMVDGGYKYFQYISDPNACSFIKKYTQENFKKILTMAGIDPPDCPVEAGEYKVDDYVFNYSELKEPCPYGSYQIYAYIPSDDKRVACIKLFAKFDRQQDD